MRDTRNWQAARQLSGYWILKRPWKTTRTATSLVIRQKGILLCHKTDKRRKAIPSLFFVLVGSIGIELHDGRCPCWPRPEMGPTWCLCIYQAYHKMDICFWDTLSQCRSKNLAHRNVATPCEREWRYWCCLTQHMGMWGVQIESFVAKWGYFWWKPVAKRW